MNDESKPQPQPQPQPRPQTRPLHEQLPKLSNWHPLVEAQAVFTAAECDQIIASGKEQHQAAVAGGDYAQKLRDSHISWLQPRPDNHWIFERARQVVAQANKEVFQLDLAGYTEPLQVTAYGPGQYFDWHLDFGNGKHSLRKLSFVAQLSDPGDYEGGDLELSTYSEPRRAGRTRGNLILFPSFILHRVTKVTAGTRRSLVGWVGGPHFR